MWNSLVERCVAKVEEDCLELGPVWDDWDDLVHPLSSQDLLDGPFLHLPN